MKRFKRITLAMLALSILAVSLAFNSGAAHAQTRTELAPQHVTMPEYSGWTGYFDYGWWLNGACISHTDMQTVLGNPYSSIFLPGGLQLYGIVSKLAGAWGITLWVVVQTLQYYDHGWGVCIDMWFHVWPQVFSQ